MGNPKEPFETKTYGPTYQPEGSGNEVGNVPAGLKEGDDLPQTGDEGDGFEGATLERLGDYLSLRVAEPQSANYYKVDASSEAAISHRDVELLDDPRGPDEGGPYTATPPVPSGYQSGGGPAGSSKTFIDEMLEKSSGAADGGFQDHHFVRIGEMDVASKNVDVNYENIKADDIIAKPAHGPGHTLYADVSASEDESKHNTIQARTSLVLQNNRFHPGTQSPYLKDGAYSKGSKGEFGTVQKTMGAYDPAAAGVDIAEMMKLGRALLVTATGHGDHDPDTPFLADMAMLPNLAQLALPTLHVESAELQASNVARDIGIVDWHAGDLLSLGGAAAEGRNPNAGGDDNSRNNSTYGQLNSHIEPFGGPLPLGMVVLAATSLLAMLAVTLLIQGLMMLLSDPFATNPREPDNENPTSLPKGHSRTPSAGNFFLDLLGIPQTHFNFILCLNRGLAGFYGFAKNIKDVTANDILDAAVNLAQSSGYYACVMRQVTRDLEQTERAITGFPNPMSGGGVGAAIGAGIGLIQEFTTSTTMRFLMTMATLGDKILIGERYAKAPMGMELDDIPESGVTRAGKSRASKNNPTLVWRQSALPSRYILPLSYMAGAVQFGLAQSQAHGAIANSIIGDKFVPVEDEAALAAADTAAGVTLENVASKNGRLQRDYVEQIENQFELEYVPFYMQDLRTNEFLGFHAFIESITDDYSPDYTTVSSYGRVDDIRIWKRTSRAINVTFFVAATNPKDFDAMWFDINKLTTLVYPQWSAGQGLEAASGDKYIMPFSQIPTSSPMIRLRIGDLIKSNYSRFNLGRLFGAGQDDAVFDLSKGPVGGDFKAKSAVTTSLLIEEKKVLLNMLVDGPTLVQGTAPNLTKVPPIAPTDVPMAEAITLLAKGARVIVKPNDSGYPRVGWEDTDEAKNNKVKITTPVVCTVLEITVPGALPIPFITPEGAPAWKVEIEDEDTRKNLDPDNKGFFVSWWSLSHTASQLDKDAGGGGALVEDETAKEPSAIQKFFGPDVNAIVRSFESTAGRGLAGHVTSLSLGYDGAPWETRRMGSKAPMWVKVTMGFAPIHDIPPGIDSDGFNRAPIYNAGRIMNGLAGPDIHHTNFNSDIDDLVKTHEKAASTIFIPTKEEPTG